VEVCFSILGIAGAILALAAVGHGIWLALAAMFRSIRGESAQASHCESLEQCPVCRDPVRVDARYCPTCHFALHGRAADELRDIAATTRQLRRLREDNAINLDECERLLDECHRARRRLLKRIHGKEERGREEPRKTTRSDEGAIDQGEAPPIPEVLPADPPPPAVPPPMTAPVSEQARRSLGSVLTAFLEERNILWGEVVGGLLIVGCSVALVISLWEALERIPYFPFLLFASITAALFGAGLYTLHRWKLHSTSRGLLAVALLLVPLDFLVLAGLSRGEASVLDIAVQATALVSFGALVSVAARDLITGQRWPMTASLIGCAAATLLVPHFVERSGSAIGLTALAWLPAICFAVPCGIAFLRAASAPLVGHRAARDLLALIGFAAFAMVAALGLVVYRGGTADALPALALPLVLASAPVLAAGLLIYRDPGADGTTEKVSPALRTLATAVALGAMFVMLIADGLAWPRPLTLLVLGLVEFVLLTAVALKYRLPVLHAVAVPALTAAYLIGFHLLSGHIDMAFPPSGDHLLQLAVSSTSGIALLPLVVLFAACSEGLIRRNRRSDALYYLAAVGSTALLSVLLTLPHQVSDAGRTALACGLSGVLAVALNLRWRRPALLLAGQILLALMVLFGVTGGLAHAAWIGADGTGLTDPRSLQAYGIGLAILALGWVLLRIAGRSNANVRSMVEQDEPPHRVLLGGLVVLALGLAVWGVFPGVMAELASAGSIVPPSVPQAMGAGAWLLLVAVTAALLAELWDWPGGAIPGLTTMVLIVPTLAAGLFADTHATASALRWGLAAVLLIASAALWLRTHIARFAPRVGIAVGEESPPTEQVRAILLVLAAGPILLMTLIATGAGFAGQWPSGPDPDSFFGHLGWVTSSLVPLVVVSAVLVGHGIRERRPGYIFAAGLIADAALAGGYALHRALGGGLDTNDGVRIAQLGSIGASVWALVWMFARRRDEREETTARPLRGTLIGLATVSLMILLAWPLVQLLFDPAGPLPVWFPLVGDVGGWLAWLLAGGAVLSHLGSASVEERVNVLATVGLGAGVLAACLVSPWDRGNWLSYHVLLLTWGSVAVALIAAGLIAWPVRAVCRWAEAIGTALALLALRGAWDDPGRPYWPIAAAGSACGISVALALWLRWPRHVHASAVLAGLIGFIVWLDRGSVTIANFLGTQAICLALALGFWSALELLLRRTRSPINLGNATRSFRESAGWMALGLLAVVVLIGFGAALDNPLTAPGLLSWAALLVVGAAFIPQLCDTESQPPAPQLYITGLLAIGLTLASVGIPAPRIGQLAALFLGGYVLLTAAVGTLAPRWLSRPADSSSEWFVSIQGIVAATVVALSAWICCYFGAPIDRLAGPAAVALLVAAGLILGARPFIRYATLALGVVVLTECGWSVLDLTAAVWMHRTVMLLAALAATTILYGVALARWMRQPAWAAAGRRLGPILGVAALVVLFVVLGQEFLLYNPDPAVQRTPMFAWAVAVVGMALVGLMAAQVRFAVRPEHDPFGLPERRRTLYVYMAEVLLVGLFIHVRLNVPWLFGGLLVQYWTLLIMGVAFLGVGLGEFFQRRGLPVLAGPLHRTGVFLPLLPLLAFWVRPPAELHNFLVAAAPGTEPLLLTLERLPSYASVPSQFARYSLLWLLLGGLYAGTAVARRSGRYALLAVLAANVALWCLLRHYGWSFLVHPQMWLVPLALIVLAAEHLNRRRLTPNQAATMRYAGLGGLYLSSTADMFIAGLGHSLILPLVLALLSVLGVLAGIALRVRAFLLMGVGFLGVVIFSMIWHAAVDLAQTWLWWASGIALGAAILALFALFEKRREDVERVVDQVRNWE
jgi:hypothetical protein